MKLTAVLLVMSYLAFSAAGSGGALSVFDESASGRVAARVRPGALLQILNNNNKCTTKVDITMHREFSLIVDTHFRTCSETESIRKYRTTTKNK